MDTLGRLSASTKMDVMGPAAEDADTAAPAGDLDGLFRAEGDGLFRTLCAFTGGRVDIAEEATAEAFARAVAHRSELRDPLAWIYRVAFASRSMRYGVTRGVRRPPKTCRSCRRSCTA